MSDLFLSTVLALSVMPLGFLFGACSACCQRPCRVFNDPLTIRVGVLVSWGASTPGYDISFNAITLSADQGIVVGFILIGATVYALVEYEDGGTQYAYIALSDISKEIDEWWHVCSGSWSINSGGGVLSSNSSGVMTFLVTDPDTPYGIFTAEIDRVADVTYDLHVKRGVDEDDKCSTPDITISYQWTGSGGDWVVNISGEDTLFVFSPNSEVLVGACVDASGVTVIFDGDRIFQKCNVPSGYYFSIGASGSGTQWKDFKYSDHYDGNPNCPLCQPSNCFPNFNRTISGFDIEISGITNGSDCGCPSTIEGFVPFEDNNLGICGFSNYGEINVTGFSGAAVPCSGATLSVSLSCSVGGQILLGIKLQHSGLAENDWDASFSEGTAPGDIAVTNLAITSTDEGVACDYANATVTASPRTVTGCCGGNPLP